MQATIALALTALFALVAEQPDLHGYHERKLYSFQGALDGSDPSSSLIVDGSGALYGTAYFGGPSGNGSVYKLTPRGSGFAYSVLYAFRGGSDGAVPPGGVVADERGALYGTTEFGGPYCARSAGCGVVFKLTPAGSGYVETTLHAFRGGSDGAEPLAGLVIDKHGNLYGTTALGGSACNCGTVFELTPQASSYTERILYAFGGGSDGANPFAGLLLAKHGTLYGTTFGGGASCGCGTVFRLAPSGSSYVESILFRFQGYPTDGSNPKAPLIADGRGVLYGTTETGGTNKGNLIAGTVFALTPVGSSYVETVLHAFLGAPRDGAEPTAGLLRDAQGALYGTTFSGGRATCGPSYLCGIAFKLAPGGSSYTETILHRFGGTNDGTGPYGGLVAGQQGVMFGATVNGGKSACRCGAVYSLSPASGGTP